jgi:hypothetical protein
MVENSDRQPLQVIFGPEKPIPPLIAATTMQRWCYLRTIIPSGIERVKIWFCLSSSSSSKQYNINNRSICSNSRGAIESSKDSTKVGHRSSFTKNSGMHSAQESKEELKPFFQRKNDLNSDKECILWERRVIN